MSAVRAGTQPTVAGIWLPRTHIRAADVLGVAAPVITLVTAVAALGVGLLAVPLKTADDWTMPAIATLAVGLLILAIHSYKRTGVLDPVPVVLLGACLIAASVLGGLPPSSRRSGSTPSFIAPSPTRSHCSYWRCRAPAPR